MRRASRWTRISALAAGAALAGSCTSGGGRPGRTNPGTGPASSPPGATFAGPVVAPPRWAPCQSPAGPPGYECASVTVPRDPKDPSKGLIAMALDRRPASGSKIGSLLVNPGGPGASGVEFLPGAVRLLSRPVLDRFDIVGFDPPGVGRTAPITCLDPAGLAQYFHTDPAPPTKAGLDALIAELKVMADGCERLSPQELPYVSTADAAMDLDLVRQDLGDAKLTYVGFSYGTVIGATYADLFPSHVRAMVLDGAEDPSLGPAAVLEQQAAAVDADLRDALAGCANQSGCAWKPGGDPLSSYQALVARVRRDPLPVAGSTRTVGVSELLFGTAATLYDTAGWPDLYQALAEASAGNGADLLKLFDAYTGRQPDGTYNNEFEASSAIGCLDAPAPSISQLEAEAETARAVAPVFGLANLYSELQCAVWRVPATGRPAALRAAGSPPILVVGSTGDPATPYAWARSLAGELEHGVLLTRQGDGHTAYPFSGCIRTAVDVYLEDLSLPAAGTTCPSG